MCRGIPREPFDLLRKWPLSCCDYWCLMLENSCNAFRTTWAGHGSVKIDCDRVGRVILLRWSLQRVEDMRISHIPDNHFNWRFLPILASAFEYNTYVTSPLISVKWIGLLNLLSPRLLSLLSPITNSCLVEQPLKACSWTRFFACFHVDFLEKDTIDENVAFPYFDCFAC